MHALVRDLRVAARSLRRSWGFAIAAVATVAIGIGATTGIFSVVKSVVLNPLPYDASDRLVSVTHAAPGLGESRLGLSTGSYFHYRAESHTVEQLGVFFNTAMNLTGDGEPERVKVMGVTWPVFPILRVAPALGRVISADDDRPGAARVAVISHGLWSRKFGQDRSVLGRVIHVDGEAHEVIGVLPPGFRFELASIYGVARDARRIEIWLPLRWDESTARLADFSYPGIGRLRPGVDVADAEAELNRLIPTLAEAYPDSPVSPAMLDQIKMATTVVPLHEAIVGDVTRTLWLLMGTVAFVLLIACANVANLLLVRAEGRQREMGLRTALGAARGHLVRYFMAENLLLATGGGAAGLALAYVGVQGVVKLGPESIPRLADVRIDGAALAFTALVSLAAGLLFGSIPVFRHLRTNLTTALKEGGRGSTSGRDRHRGRHTLVGAQIALALVLLVGSGLMVRSFWNLLRLDPGFDAANVLTMRLSLTWTEFPEATLSTRFYLQLVERLEALPGVEAAGATTGLPLDGTQIPEVVQVEDDPLEPDEIPPLYQRKYISPGYFSALGIPVLDGREIDRRDHDLRLAHAVVNAAFAERYWPRASAIGRRLRPGTPRDGNAWYTIVGVVGSVRDESLAAAPPPIVYFPMIGPADSYIGDEAWTSMAIAVRTTMPPAAMATAVRREVWSFNPNVPITEVQTMARLRADSTSRTSFTLLMLGAAAGVAVLLGAIGVYGVIAYVVSQRTQEIGVRMAIGAHARDVQRMILRQGAVVSLAGVTVGLAGALVLSRLLTSLLFGVSATDPIAYVAVSVFLVAVTLLACWVPARRAAKVDPVRALRLD